MADTVKGALYHEYDLRTHQFIAHIRPIHPLNKDIGMVLDKGITVLKAANPLAALGKSCECITFTANPKMYNELFFMIWENVMSPTFALNRLFELELVG